MSDVSLVFNLVGRDRVSPTIQRVAGNVHGAAVRSVASTALMGAAMASAASWAVALGGAGVTAAAGIGLIPGAAMAAAAAVMTLGLGTSGLGEAWKQTSASMSAGGGGAVDTAHRVAQAQHEVRLATLGLTDAQKRGLAAQQALTQAREDEAQRIADLTRSLAGARLDEESAVDAVADAERGLQDARRTGNLDQIGDADRAYRQSLQTLDDVRARVQGLEKDKTKADAQGVEGSAAVTSALDQQQQSVRDLEEAQWRLQEAQLAVNDAMAGPGGAGGVDKAAEAMAKLSPNAQQLIRTLHSLGAGWTAMRMAVQDRLFEGVSKDVVDLSGAYLPVLRRNLVDVAGGFNATIHQASGLMKSKAFVADVDTMLGNASKTLRTLGQAVTPIINGFAQLGAVGSSFLPGIAGSTLSIAQAFEKWMVQARQSGQLQAWLQGAVDVLTSIWHIGANVVKIVIDIFTAGGNQAAGAGLLDKLERGTAAMHAFLSSAEGQEKISNALETLRNIVGNVGAALAGLKDHGDELSDSLSVAGAVVKFLADHSDLLAAALPYLAAGFVVVKTAETAANIAGVVRLPIIAAQTVANWRLGTSTNALTVEMAAATAAQRANSVATGASTVATNAGDAAQKRSVISMAASKAASLAMSAASKVAAAGQWLLNVAMSANPIGLIVIAIVALIAGIWWLWNHSEGFRKFWIGAWDMIKGAALAVWDWVKENWPLLLAIITGPIGLAVRYVVQHWDQIKDGARAAVAWISDRFAWLVDWVQSLPGRIASAASNMWHGIGDAFRSMLNWVIGRWNGLQFRIPGGDFLGMHFDGFTLGVPKIPYLATGGTVTRSGVAMVGEKGPELVKLGPGASVIPLDRAAANIGGAGGSARLVLDLRGADGEMKRLVRKWIRTDNLLQGV